MPETQSSDPAEAAAEQHVQDIMEPNSPLTPSQPDEVIAPQTAPPVPGTPVSEPPVPTEVSGDTPVPEDLAADAETDKAVDDIMKHDGDEALKAQDEAAEVVVSTSAGHWQRFKRWWAKPKVHYSVLGAVVVILAMLFTVPLTRYDILGLVLEQQATVQAVDSKTGKPVSGVTVEIDGRKAQTEADGKAILRVHAGSKTLTAGKQYYRSYSNTELVTLSAAHNVFRAPVVALGRRVPVKIVDKVTGKPLAGAVIHLQGTQTKADKNGQVTVVVPSSAGGQEASISLTGYNTAAVTITPGGDAAKNTFSLVPAGKLYFLSNLSGKIDVVKTNLDGTSRQTVLVGTGSEDPNTTSLLASRDWKYLALLANRGSGANVYLINTATDKLTTIDQGAATFSLVGWSGDSFIYQMTRTNVSDWQTGQQALKAFDPTTGKALLLDQTQASGASEADYVKQYFGAAYLMNGQVVYSKGWTASYADLSQLSAKQAELDSIAADGSGHRTIKAFTPTSSAQVSSVTVDTEPYGPDGLYIHFTDGTADQFYDYDNGQLNTDTKLTISQFWSTAYPTYLQSPSGNQTFWAEQRDGKNTLFIGDADGGNQKQIATLSDYSPYGWYTDSYLLVSENSSELYIMPAAGGTPLKITDYYKPPLNYNGYGGGYGGL